MAKLIAADGTSFELAESETLVGRGERQVGDPPKVNLGSLPGGLTVSRHHVRLRQQRGEWQLEVERQSTNHTMVDGMSLPKGLVTPIKDGTRLQLGEVVVVFRGPAASQDEADDTLEREPVPTDGSAASDSLLIETSPPVLPQAGPWVGRLPAQTTLFQAVGTTQLTRVNPFEGLMVDADTWADDQAYHRAAARLHVLSNHGWGIAEGLEVVISPHAPRTLVVRAGFAVDPLGRMLLLAADMQLAVAVEVGSTAYVSMSYVDHPTRPQSAWDGDEHATRILESVQLSVDRRRPEPPALELARLAVAEELHDAAHPTNPQPGEVDLRFRERQLVRPRPDLAIAQLSHAPAEDNSEFSDAHRLGLRFVSRELAQTTSYRPRWLGSVELDQALPAAAVLYFTGGHGFPPLTELELEHLKQFLGDGGVLLADPCRAGNWQEFAASVEKIAENLGVSLQPVERWHPLLLARHVFTAPPLDLPHELPLVEGGGIVLSCFDYGCAWQGGLNEEALGRERIRAALELGTNIAVFGQQRRRPLDVLDFEA